MTTERTAFIKAHHPDRGGDPDYFAAGLAQFDRDTYSAYDGRVRVVAFRRRGPVQRIVDAVRRHVRPAPHPARVR